MLLGVAMNFALLPLMTAQWRLLLPSARRAPWRRLWSCVTLSMASMNTLPFGGGHAVAVGLIATRGISTVSGGASLLALEQVCEALAKLALLVFVLWAARLPAPLWRAGWLSLAVVAVAVAMVVLMRRKRSRSGTPAWWHSWTQHWETLRRPRPFGVACGLSVAMKLAALIAIDAVQRSLGVNLPWASTALVLAAVTFATMMSVAPGNVGLYELAAIAAYRFIGVPDRLAASLAVLVHLAFLIPIVGTGYGALAAKVWRTRRHAGAAPP